MDHVKASSKALDPTNWMKGTTIYKDKDGAVYIREGINTGE
jgi:hypothetical protein